MAAILAKLGWLPFDRCRDRPRASPNAPQAGRERASHCEERASELATAKREALGLALPREEDARDLVSFWFHLVSFVLIWSHLVSFSGFLEALGDVRLAGLLASPGSCPLWLLALAWPPWLLAWPPGPPWPLEEQSEGGMETTSHPPGPRGRDPGRPGRDPGEAQPESMKFGLSAPPMLTLWAERPWWEAAGGAKGSRQAVKHWDCLANFRGRENLRDSMSQ